MIEGIAAPITALAAKAQSTESGQKREEMEEEEKKGGSRPRSSS